MGAEPAIANFDLVAGARVGRYLVTRRVAAGAMGVVYEAFDPELERRVALKVLRPELLERRKSVRERLLREAQALAMVEHPNVVRVFDVGPVRNSLFIAMEFVAGRTGREWLREDPTWRRVLDVFTDAARGLAAIHAAGLVHRDFKPSNVVIGGDGRVRVLDLGLARAIGLVSSERSTQSGVFRRRRTGERTGPRPRVQTGPRPAAETSGSHPSGSLLQAPMTMVGTTVGTPQYMAPEQHAGEDSDDRADQFAFCVSLYEALVGTRPFRGRSTDEIADAKNRGSIPPPPADSPVPKAVFRVLARGMRPEPARRWPSMQALVKALDRARANPRERWAIFGAAIGAAIVTGAFAWAGGFGPTDRCDAADSGLHDVWNDRRAQLLRTRLLASKVPYAADAWTGSRARIEAFAEDWSQAWTTACVGQIDAEPSDRHAPKMACLAARLDELDARLDVLEAANPTTVENAVITVAGLESPHGCLERPETEGLPAPAPAIAADVEAVRRAIERSRAREDAGDLEAAVTAADEALVAAGRVDYPPIRVDARLRRGRALAAAHRQESAGEALREAAIEATAAGHDRAAAEAAIAIASLNTVTDPEDAERWLRQAQATIVRLDDPPELRRQWLNARGLVDLSQDRPQRAIDHLEAALDLTRSLHDDLHPAVARAYDNLALATHRAGDLDGAQRLSADALRLLQAELGPRHPSVARALVNAGSLAIAAGHYERATERFRQALEIQRTVFGDDAEELVGGLDGLGTALANLGRHAEALELHRDALVRLSDGPAADPMRGSTHLSIGYCLSGLQRHEEALQEFERARDLFATSLGEGHRATAAALNDIGTAQQLLERWDDARASYEGALAMLEASPSPPVDLVAKSLGNLGFLSHRAGELPRAREELSRALTLLDRPGTPDPYARARLQIALAEVELDLGHHEEARVLLEPAQAELRALDARAEDLERAQRLLARADDGK